MIRFLLAVIIAFTTVITSPGLILCSSDDALAGLEFTGHPDCMHIAHTAGEFPALSRHSDHHDTPLPCVAEATNDRTARYHAPGLTAHEQYDSPSLNNVFNDNIVPSDSLEPFPVTLMGVILLI